MAEIGEVSLQQIISLKSTEANDKAKALMLKLGSIVQAKVLDLNEGQVRLKIGIKTFSAENTIALKVGENIALKVIQTGERPLLALVKPGVTPAATSTPQAIDPSQINKLTPTATKAITPPLPSQITPASPKDVTAKTNEPIKPISTAPPEIQLREIVKVLLPKQVPLQALLSNLVALKESPELKQLPKEIQAAIQSFSKDLPPAKQLHTTEGLKKAIQQSGLNLEQQLLKMVAVAPKDLKVNLLTLLSLIKPYSANIPPSEKLSLFNDQLQRFSLGTNSNPLNPAQVSAQGKMADAMQHLPSPELILKALQQLTEGALARLEIKQLSHRADEPGFLFNVELPFLDKTDIRLLHLQIAEEQQRKEKEQQRQWTVSLALDLGELGPLHAKLSLKQENIQALFWAELETTAELIRQNLPLLHESLAESGFEVQQITCYHGAPPENNKPSTTPQTGLVDELI
ncbi:MAG: flagellar hook-length control protein FliK [Methylococcales bacterium]|jgi:hypothetical protein|nr:flagellar hook-length control protein FliK [Methylococcales bacterium]MBT7443719.1 flagellar hook-length control protein FliK [Methylococcales bacterium]